MQGIKTVAEKISSAGASALPFTLLQKICGYPLFLPFYHTISDRPLAHISPIYPVRDARLFEKDLDFLLKHFRPLGLEEVLQIVAGDKEKVKNGFFLSFDDGLTETESIIAPILLRKGIPAAFFVNSGFIDNKALFYRYKAALIISHCNERPLNVNSYRAITNCLGKSVTSPIELSHLLLSIRYDEQYKLDELAQILGISFSDFLAMHKPYLSQGQVKKLLTQGFHIGAHSIDHPMYKYIPLAEQIRQTEQSLLYLNEVYGIKQRLFAFPFTDDGVSKSFFDHFYKNDLSLDLSFGGAGLKKDIYPRHLQRYPIEGSMLSAAKIIPQEYFYYLLKKPFGKNTIKRA